MANYPKIISVTPSYLEHCVYMSVLFFFAGNRPRKYHLRRKCRNYKSVKMAVLVLALILIVGIYINYAFILNGATTTKVSPSGNDAIAVLHGMKSILILNPNLMLTMTYQGNVVLQGILNVTDSKGINPINCSETFHADVCLEWSNNVRLTMSVNRSAAQDLDCYDIEWTALQCVDQVLTDCFNIGTTHWYGGYQNFNQYWPLSKSTQTMTAYVSHDIYKGDIGDVLDRYLFSSKGTGFYIDSEVPLYFSMNDTFDMMCFSAKYEKFPYQNFDNKYPVLRYKICQSDNVKTIHSKMSSMLIPKPTGIPDTKMFQYPIWSTWAQYKKDINQSTVMSFAHDILANNFSHAQLEIDDFWTPTYGDYVFDIKKFPNATAMVRQLNDMGFRVTVWVNPFFNIDSQSFAEGAAKSYFICSYNTNRPALVEWWDGAMAGILDPTNPAAVAWYLDKLENLKKVYNISSFKFDAGEAAFLPPVYSAYKPERDPGNIFPKAYVEMVVQSDKSRHLEVRVGYHTQEHPTFVRIMDKDSKWEHTNGLKSVIPVVLTFGLLGYPFVLPDMIGGNLYHGADFDAILYIRWLELNALLPSMQFSLVPWQNNDTTIVKIAQKFTKLHEHYSTLLIKLAQESTVTGYPIIRPVWWMDPYSEDALICEDEFLVGEEILVAPVVEQNAISRDIYLPPGNWHDQLRNKTIQGKTWLSNYRVELDELAYFIRTS